MNKLKKTLYITLVIILVLATAFLIYTGIYYKADKDAVNMIENSQNIDNSGRFIVFEPIEPDLNTGLIFYPGGKVDENAYAPLLKEISDRGVTVILAKMPFNLAVFGINTADRVYELFPDIETWYIGGHSLGGAMASSYAGKNSDKIEGLILLGAYPLNDAVPQITIYGSEDFGLDKSKLQGNDNLIEIKGGNHAYFGNYGEQRGDGEAYITREQQQNLSINAVLDFMN